MEELIKNSNVLIFDLDGTIANTEVYHLKAYNTFLSDYGIKLSNEDFLKYMGNSEYDIYNMIKKDYNIDFCDQIFLNKRLKIYLELIKKDDIKPYSWVLDLLNSNRILFLVTSQKKEIVDFLINYWNLNNYFNENNMYFCSDKLKKIQAYNIIKEKYSNITLFEDSIKYLKMGKELGFNTIAIEHPLNINQLGYYDKIIKRNI